MSRFTSRLRLAVLTGLLATVGALSCSDDATDPERARSFTFAVVPTLQSSSAAGLVDVAQIRFVLVRAADESVVYDETVDVPEGSDEVQLDITVTISSSDELFLLTLTLFDPSGNVVFVGGPIEVTATAEGDTPPPPLAVPLTYTGIGADAVAVVIQTPDTALFFGQTLQATADALDDQDEPIPGTPIAWSSVDALADVPDEATGQVIAGNARGVARVIATLLTGPADTVSIVIQGSPSSIFLVAGDGQRALPGTELPEAITVQVRDDQGDDVADIEVEFLTSDGSLSVQSVRTDSEGVALTTWTLGANEGLQTISVSLPEFPNVTATVTATAVLPNTLVPVSDGQRGAVDTPVPAIVQVLAGDGLGIAGITVEFRSTFGSVSPFSTTSDAEGFAQTTWTLGPNEGDQTIEALVPDYDILTTMTATAFIAPPAGTDIVVFNDMNMFDETAMQDLNNQLLVRNLVGFTSQGFRTDGTAVFFDRGRASPCFANGECTASNNATLISVIQSMGLVVVEVASDTLPDAPLPPEVKVAFLWNPTIPFDPTEVGLAQEFLAEGGRIVFIGEWDGFYGQAGLDTENQFLLDMGAQMTNTGGAVDCGYNELPASSILLGHQVTTGLTGLTIACASIINPGPQDFPIMYDLGNTLVLGGVAVIGQGGAPPAVSSIRARVTDAAQRQGLNPRSGAGRRQ
jgi:hypothetical protein